MQKIEISHKTIFFIAIFLIGLWLLYQLSEVVILWFISFILMTAMNPMVTRMEQWRIPRTIGIILAFIFTGSLIGLIFAGIIPPFIEQTVSLAKNIDKVLPENQLLTIDYSIITSQIETISKSAVNVLRLAVGAFSNLFTIFSIMVLTFYFLMERKNLTKYLSVLIGDGQSERRAEELIDNIEARLGGWVRGELALMLIVGTLSYIGLILLGIPFALPLALLAGLMELIPNIGPTISAIPAILMGFTISPAIAFGALILYLAVQQLENNIIVPMVMKQSVGLQPIVTLMALMIGLSLGGILGAILAVPIFITAQTILVHIYKYQKEKKKLKNKKLSLTNLE